MVRKTANPERKNGATRRQPPRAEHDKARFDRWLDDLVSWSVAAAVLVGGLAILVALWGKVWG